MLAGTAVAILTTVFPANERGKVLGINVAATYTGLSLGPIFGGLLTQHLGWRSIFFLSAALGLVVVSVVSAKLKGEWAEPKRETFDFLGAAIYIVGLVALVYGFTLLPAKSAILLIVDGVIALCFFIVRETRVRSPLLDINLFKKSKAFTFSNLSALINYSATYGCLLYTSDAADE